MRREVSQVFQHRLPPRSGVRTREQFDAGAKPQQRDRTDRDQHPCTAAWRAASERRIPKRGEHDRCYHSKNDIDRLMRWRPACDPRLSNRTPHHDRPDPWIIGESPA